MDGDHGRVNPDHHDHDRTATIPNKRGASLVEDQMLVAGAA